MRTIPVVAALLLGTVRPALPQDADREGVEFFEKKIRPVLADHCYRCHSGQAEKLKAGLLLDSRAGMLKGGDQGPALKPGDPDASLLVKAVRYADEDLKMPPKGKLASEVVKDFEAWIRRGAPMPADTAGAPAAPKKKGIDLEQGRKFWSFRPLASAPPPAVRAAAWVRTPVDRFILARLEERGIATPSAADPRRLIRRASFGLTGLPPSPEDVDAFVRDPSPEAYAKAVDRLLESPHYGERWARHWLDVARFAESHGFEQDYDRENAYFYRDFVIRAFNQDMPYDQFVRWQLAGDELAPDDPLAWMATGFLGAGAFPTQLTEVEFEPARYDELDNMTSTMGAAMLGLSVGCARCHDHKFDPIPSRDFYRLAATFTAAIRSHKEFDFEPEATRKALAEWESKHAPLASALEAFERQELPARFEAWMTERAWEKPEAKLPGELVKEAKAGRRDKALEQYKKVDEEWKKRNKPVQDSLARKPGPAKVLVTTEGLKPLKHHADDRGFPHFYKETYILARGDVNKKQGVADPGFLQVLSRASEDRWISPPPPGSRTPHRRAALARWLTDVEAGAGPLLARVIVNRLWQHHFGRGLVSTANDFGAQGELPSHPELLDWLAGELIRQGWRLKPLHKLLLTSAVYLESADSDPARAIADPDNRLFWRREPRRLEAESIRDSLLAVSGLLDRRMFGPGTLDESMTRRSLYFFVKRSRLISMLQVFDAPEPLVPIGSRPTTTIAPQALLFMNSPQVRRSAAAFAARLSGAAEPVREAYRTALGRSPTPDEARAAAIFLEEQSASYAKGGKGDAHARALADFCQALFCLNEFVYVD